jgi:hypothetical protein
LIPSEFNVFSIGNEAERHVTENFRDRRSDLWHIIPRLDVVTHDRPYEVDVPLLYEYNGIIRVGVEAGLFRVEEGVWKRRGEVFDTSPPRQAQNACYALRDRLRDHDPMFKHIGSCRRWLCRIRGVFLSIFPRCCQSRSSFKRISPILARQLTG